MAFEPGSAGLSISPTNSGRASPVSRNYRAQRSEDESLPKDKNFKRYASGVERSLSLFDTALQEWADYISFLGRLLKSLQSHPSNVAVIPSKVIVAKRLAQCLNPSLPSGVHQKALEVYGFIFQMIGKDALARDLPLYLPGLSSTLSFASLTVRAPFLSLVEKHILNLDTVALRPALKAIILALLPGLEEETSEDFERTLQLLNGFKEAIKAQNRNTQSGGDEFFWQCFFLASITSNSRRSGALAYLVRYLPKLGQTRRGSLNQSNGDSTGEPDAEKLADAVTSPEPGLLLRCFAAGLADDQILIQRGFLDLLVTHLPIHCTVLQRRVKPEDLERLLTAAAGVTARRDMSLNRRLWNWLLGPEPSSEMDTEGNPQSPTSTVDDLSLGSSRTRYFEDFGLQPLTRALLKMVSQNQLSPTERARPFRICLSLMDRWEIGGLVVPEIFLPVVNSVRLYSEQCSNRSHFNEVLRSASVFFDGVESGLIWSEMIGLLAEALGSGNMDRQVRLNKLTLVSFIISHFNVREEEMLLVHAPTSALTILAMIDDVIKLKNNLNADADVINTAVGVAQELVDLTSERAFLQQTSAGPDQPLDAIGNSTINPKADILSQVKTFYVHNHGNLDSFRPPFSSKELGELLVSETAKLTCQSLSNPASSADAGVKIKLFCSLLGKTPRTESLGVLELLSSIRGRLSANDQVPFAIFSSLTALICSLHRNSYLTADEISSLVDPLVRIAWFYLSSSHPKYHVEAVRYLWLLQTTLSLTNHEIEAAICTIIIENDATGTYDNRGAGPGRTFSILWTHTLQDTAGQSDRRGSKPNIEPQGLTRASGTDHYAVMLARPLFLLLDALTTERTQLFMTVRTWLQNLIGIDRLFHLFVAKFATFSFLQSPLDSGPDSDKIHEGKAYVESDDLDQCLYYLQTLSNILRWSSDNTLAALVDNVISTDKSHRALFAITLRDREVTLQEFLVHVCLRAIHGTHNEKSPQLESSVGQLHRTALSVLHQILLSPYALPLEELHLEHVLVERLACSLDGPDPFMQVSLLDVVFAALKIRNTMDTPALPTPTIDSRRGTAHDLMQASRLSLVSDRELAAPTLIPPPPALIKCLQSGFASPKTRPVLDSWVSFLTEILPFYTDTIFQVLIPLVETLCTEVEKTFLSLQATFRDPGVVTNDMSAPETTLISLLNGLEQVLARGHDCLMSDEARTIPVKTPEQPQGFFGNMASGLFSSETPQSRSATANNRLTVLLSFQDAVRICFTIWSWGGQGSTGETQDSESSASFSYTSLRMRNRARRLLEHLFAAEALECLETVVEIWQKSTQTINDKKPTVVINLLHVLDGSRPKHTIPAIFNAIYSRTNPAALDPARTSTLTSVLQDVDLVVFLVEYARSLEDDAMDEIWTDCMTFLKDILANPFPHRQTLPSLLEFAAILGEKVDNTNFGEQRRMRKELGDLFLRLLTATFTTKPMGFAESPIYSTIAEKDVESSDRPTAAQLKQAGRSEDIVSILASIASKLPKILVEPDRVLNAANTISNSVIGPTFRSKSFPDNISKSTLELLYHVARLPNTQKAWKKDLAEAFNDARFFSNPVSLVDSDWLPLLRQWALSDKDRMPELLSRLAPPSTAGIVFGVGATSARLEADRRTQLNLRRIATLVLAAAEDTFVADLGAIEEKLVELLGATATSSPSSTTRADIYMVLRALALKTSPIHLGFLWPIINAELHAAISSVVAADHSQTSELFTNFSVLQACKLLDVLLCIAPDDFQLHEWLFITDTIDAVYRPADFQPVALIDELSEELGSKALISSSNNDTALTSSQDQVMRRPLIGSNGISDDINLERKDELIAKVLRPFFSQLSIFAFESVYGMGSPDLNGCRDGLLRDLFDERGVGRAL